jgi:hypothetical protein
LFHPLLNEANTSNNNHNNNRINPWQNPTTP